MNSLHYAKAEHLKTVQSAWSDDRYEKVPFSCDPRLTDGDVRDRISSAIYKKFPPRHYAGCGYSCSVSEFHRERPDGGHVVLMHYQGIGD